MTHAVNASGSLRGQLVLPDRVQVGTLAWDGAITRITLEDQDDPTLPWVAPGFVDQHVHGGGGGDTMEGEASVRALARHHLQHGTTALLPTTLTAPWPAIVRALEGVRAVMHAPAHNEAQVLGAHLEGPFISPQRLGAQPPHAITADLARVHEAVALNVVRLVTVAPEAPGVMASLSAWVQAGVRVNVGHTRATTAQTEALLAAVRALGGFAGGTHLFNAMGGMEGRDAGVVGALLADADAAVEVIADGAHLTPASIRVAWRAARERLVLITDAIAASGVVEGQTTLGGQRVLVQGGVARLADGTLAGSVLTMDAAVRGAVAAGVPVAAALRAASMAPAAYLGLRDRGVLRVGARADVVVLGSDLGLQGVWLGGVRQR